MTRWSPNGHPYQLSYADLPSVLHALADLRLDRLPGTAGLWPAMVTTDIDSREGAAALLQREHATAPIAATVRALLRGTPRERREHIAMLAIARRVWNPEAPAREQADLLYALGHFRRYRGLLLMLDRIGVRDPSVFARLVDAARRVDGGGGRERALRLNVVQGALALVERTSLVDAIGPQPRTRGNRTRIEGEFFSSYSTSAKSAAMGCGGYDTYQSETFYDLIAHAREALKQLESTMNKSG